MKQKVANDRSTDCNIGCGRCIERMTAADFLECEWPMVHQHLRKFIINITTKSGVMFIMQRQPADDRRGFKVQGLSNCSKSVPER